VYVGGVEEVATSGGTTTTTTYYSANRTRIALGVNGAISYLASDALGSAVVAFGSNGTATASVLYAPYGAVRYSAGTMPTSFGFTGQRSDAVSGLDYYGARYYDPVAGQFASADTVQSRDVLGLSRYAYVKGNPIVRTDPTGHKQDEGGGDPSCVGYCPPPGSSGGNGCDILPGCAPPPDPGPAPGQPPGGCDCGGPSPAPIQGPAADPTPSISPSGFGDSGQTHCMCADPNAGVLIETIPWDQWTGPTGMITYPGPDWQRVLDEFIPIELRGGGTLITVGLPHMPDTMFGSKSRGGKKSGNQGDNGVVKLGPDGQPIAGSGPYGDPGQWREGTTAPGLSRARPRDLQTEPPSDGKAALFVWAVGRWFRGVINLPGG
jgi:RHS repeat-associated protein